MTFCKADASEFGGGRGAALLWKRQSNQGMHSKISRVAGPETHPPPPPSTSPVEWPSNRYDRPSILAEWLFEDFMTYKG